MSKSQAVTLSDEAIMSKIYLVRGHKVMLDRNLAQLYDVETKVLKQAVRRNYTRFPEDFMFEMNKEEFADWRSHFVTSNQDKQGLRYAPFCFTEHGILMLSNILSSEKAIQMNIYIIRVFIRLRELILQDKAMLIRLEQLERRIDKHDEKIELLFTYISKLIEKPEVTVVKVKGFEIKSQKTTDK